MRLPPKPRLKGIHPIPIYRNRKPAYKAFLLTKISWFKVSCAQKQQFLAQKGTWFLLRQERCSCARQKDYGLSVRFSTKFLEASKSYAFWATEMLCISVGSEKCTALLEQEIRIGFLCSKNH